MQVQFSNIPISLDAMLPNNEKLLRKEVCKACGITKSHVGDIRVIRKSIDARRKSNVHFVITAVAQLPEFTEKDLSHINPQKGISAKRYEEPAPLRIPDLSLIAAQPEYLRPVVVGAGPAGLFCALYLARAGLRPLVIERGKPTPERMRDIEDFASGGKLGVNSNVQFGEGGAGTFSDGKLNTGIKSSHIRHILKEFVESGAPEDILIEAKPHIGTDKLVDVVQNLRHAIEDAGGEFCFNTLLEDIVFSDLNRDSEESSNKTLDGGSPLKASDASLKVAAIKARHLNYEGACEIETIPVNALILAIGHSARDTFAMLHELGLKMSRKPFAMGMRIEHLQEDLNRSQYGRFADHPVLGAADYKLAAHTDDGRGVYTFCMCPGGEVVAAASEECGVCVNGMSRHARDEMNGNSALLVEVKPEDLPGDDVLEGVRLQRELERKAYDLGMRRSGIPYTAPVQTVEGFLNDSGGKPSSKVAPTYPIGVSWENLRDMLPAFMADSIVEALPMFAKRLDAFNDGQAVLTGIEARSSSPVRIERNKDNLSSVSAMGLYPCGEGAGYAGGIMSAAVDGIRVAEAICANM